MKNTRLLMGMPITVEVVDSVATKEVIEKIYDYFQYVDNTFSTYKPESEISKINKGLLKEKDWSQDMKMVFKRSEQTKKETNGYFDIYYNGTLDPSGLVKGWAIHNAANMLQEMGFSNYYVDAGGDIQVHGRNSRHKLWQVGIRNPFNRDEIVKVLAIENGAVATSGTYIRGQHIYNPKNTTTIDEIVSLTVVGSDIYDADRFATAAFAMGSKGIEFIDQLKGLEGYMIDKNGTATYTSGFTHYVV